MIVNIPCRKNPGDAGGGSIIGARRSCRRSHKENEMKKQAIPEKHKKWIDARKRFKLTDAQIQMARELGLNPKKFGSLANHKQQPWKAPLGEFIEHIYEKRFKKTEPDLVRSIKDVIKAERAKKELRKARKLARAAEDKSGTEPAQ